MYAVTSGLSVRIVTDGRSPWTVGSRAVAHDVMSLPDPWIRKHAFRLLGQNCGKCGWLGGAVSYLRQLNSSISESGRLGGAPSVGTRLPLPVKMKFLMQPIRRSTVLEEVNDSDILMEPLHYPVAIPVVEQQFALMQAVSINGQICGAGGSRCRKGRFTAGIRAVDWPDDPKRLLDGPEVWEFECLRCLRNNCCCQ